MDNVTGEREPEVSSLMTSFDHFEVPGSSLIVGAAADVLGSILMLSLDQVRPEVCNLARTMPVEDGTTKADGIVADVIVAGFLSNLVPRVKAS